MRTTAKNPNTHNSTLDDLRKIIAEIRNHQAHHRGQAYATTLASLDRITRKSHATAQKIIHEKHIVQATAILRQSWQRYETELEFKHTRKLLKADNPKRELQTYPLINRYRKFLRAEARMARLQKGDRVMFLGCGPLPLSAIILAKEHGVKVTGIDICPRCCALAKKIIRRLDMEEHITILQADARNIPVEAEVVWIAALAHPKKEILENLGKGHPTIIARTAFGLRTLLYEPIEEGHLNGWRVTNRWVAQGTVANSSLSLEKIT